MIKKANKHYKDIGSVCSPMGSVITSLVSKKSLKSLEFDFDESKRLRDFRDGYNLGHLDGFSVEEAIESRGKEYAQGIIKRYKDENFYSKFFTPLRKYNKVAKEYLHSKG